MNKPMYGFIKCNLDNNKGISFYYPSSINLICQNIYIPEECNQFLYDCINYFDKFTFISPNILKRKTQFNYKDYEYYICPIESKIKKINEEAVKNSIHSFIDNFIETFISGTIMPYQDIPLEKAINIISFFKKEQENINLFLFLPFAPIILYCNYNNGENMILGYSYNDLKINDDHFDQDWNYEFDYKSSIGDLIYIPNIKKLDGLNKEIINIEYDLFKFNINKNNIIKRNLIKSEVKI